ncbi:YcaO-like family protein [Cryptosporangium arvum]|uniref:YcaO domain-containing protein n=1 Tax=Cryptosporangium arvum DSM 44712 TaxID=927661 RepID=A0A010ZR31_9ACTN|nr:YcaO-like family protein [Cryptosporangium arvum]EXG81129.1 hypothetical protein CryarDRAFT_2233 [Cryptosporangium arvum DSM 44712]
MTASIAGGAPDGARHHPAANLRTRVPKHEGRGPHREVPPETTWSRVEPHLRRAGVTRLADVTGLDRVGLPVYTAVVPRSNDTISVYAGKGPTRLSAKVSAVMEAMERFAAWLPVRPAVVASYAELDAAGRVAVDPRSVCVETTASYRPDGPLSWVTGWDLLAGEPVLVPQDAAVYQRRLHEPPTYRIATTNGLASGNSIEEAVCHALCEVIERDALTLADLVSGRLVQLAGRRGLDATALEERHPVVGTDSLTGRAAEVVAAYERAALRVRLIEITSDLRVPTYVATTEEDLGPGTSRCHSGWGTHPDAEVAIVRALTECAQSRAVDVQAMREDISAPGEEVSRYERHTRRAQVVRRDDWVRRTTEPVSAAARPSYPSGDVAEDIRLMLGRLRDAGLPRVVVVDLSPPEIPVSVVRVLVPGLESWAVDHSKVGARAAAVWNAGLAEVTS